MRLSAIVFQLNHIPIFCLIISLNITELSLINSLQLQQSGLKMTEIPFSMTTLFHNKKINLRQVNQLISSFLNSQTEIPLTQKYSIICSIANFFVAATKNCLKDIEHLKYEVCYISLQNQTKKKRRTTSGKKRYQRGITENNIEKSMEQIFQEVVESGKSQIEMQPVMPTPKKIPVVAENSILVTVPPFQPQIMAQITQDLNQMEKSQQKSDNLEVWQPKLLNYQKWLALTQQGISITSENKRNTRTRRKSNKKQIKLQTDEKIDVSQGVQYFRDLEKLTTKVKMSHQKHEAFEGYYQKQLTKLHPILTKIQQLAKKAKSNLAKSFQNGRSAARNMSNNKLSEFEMVSMSELIDYGQRQDNKSSEFFVIQENNPTITERLQQNIKCVVNNQLISKPYVQFNKFCSSRNITKQIKGQLFYQLLHMEYRLEQSHPQNFGEIKIKTY